MEFDLSMTMINALLARISADSTLAERLSTYSFTNGRILVPDNLFTPEELDALEQIAIETEDRALRFQVIAARQIRLETPRYPTSDLATFFKDIKTYLSENAIDGWVYRRNRDGVMLPWYINGIEYINNRSNEHGGLLYVAIQLLANTQAATTPVGKSQPNQWHTGMTSSIIFYEREMGRFSIPELMARKGFYKECTEFKEDYEKQVALFRRYQPQFGKQFRATNSAFLIKRDDRSVFNTSEFFRLPPGGMFKCVNDEEEIERRIETHSSSKEVFIQGTEGLIPIHCYLHMFHLDLHENCWVHVQNLQEYVYRPEIQSKLILPAEHRRLIDILTSHMDVLMDDIIEGKSGGTTILCMGAPGLGKTLTAEVYSEVVGKPLYRVHSGQLGTTAQTVEAALADILKRASRWDSILLLDEADLYIRKRDNNLEHNAIVAEFLRTLEYFNGLLFLTTNREDDVDDAIVSRCIAVIRYETPSRDAAIRLWHSLADQFNVDLSDGLVYKLVRDFPNSSGRDIKELLKLTSRLCRSTNTPITLEAFHECAVFRGK